MSRFLIGLLLSWALFGWLSPYVDVTLPPARASPDMVPTDGDAWTENDNATYPWRSDPAHQETVAFDNTESYVGSYSFKITHTSAWTRMRWYLNFSTTDLSSYDALELWVKPVWDKNIASERALYLYVEDAFNSNPRYYCKTKPSNNSWGKIYVPVEAFLVGGSPSWTNRRLLHFYVSDNVGAADGSIVYVDGIRFLTHRTPSVNTLSESMLPNFYGFMKQYQEVSNIIFNGTTYTTLLDWANITDGASMEGNLEAESLGQTVGALALCFNATNNERYLDDANTYANWLLNFQNDTYFGGGIAYEYNNATSTWDDFMGTTVSGWVLWGMSVLYGQTSNATYKTFCDELADCLVSDAWLWNSTVHTWDTSYDQVTGWVNATSCAWSMQTGGALAGLGAYCRYVENNATMEGVVNDFYSNLGANSLNELQMGGVSEDTMYNAWGMYECWHAFSNNTYRNEMLDPMPLYYHANAEVSGNGSLFNYPFLSDGSHWDKLAGWAGCVGSPLLMISYDHSSNETAAFKRKAYERFVLDWVYAAKGDAWAIEFEINDGNPDKSWCPAQMFLHYGLLRYYDNFYSDPYLATSDGEATAYSFSSNTLDLTIDATGTSTNDIYCGSDGTPTYILHQPFDLDDYNATTTIYTHTITHTSQEDLLLNWGTLGSNVYFESSNGTFTTAPTLANGKLRFTINATGTSSTEVYTGWLGNATYSTGVSSLSYAQGTKLLTATVAHSSTETVTLSWYSETEVTGGTIIDDVDFLMLYLTNLDFIGFFVACYTTRIGEGFYALVMLAFSVVLYNRTESLPLCCILWLLVGSLGFIAAAPSISPFAVILMSMGIIGLIYKTVWGGA